MKKKLKIGLIVPPQNNEVPPEATILYGDAVDFTANGLGIEKMREEDFSNALERIDHAVDKLLQDGVDAISVMGTSLTFFQGRRGNEDIIQRLRHKAPNIPTTTLSSSIINALQHARAQKIAVFTAYSDEMNQRLEGFLSQHNIEVTQLDSLGLIDIKDVHGLPEDELLAHIEKSLARAKKEADALFISCGGLRTLAINKKSEEFPIFSSSVDGIKDIVRLARQA